MIFQRFFLPFFLAGLVVSQVTFAALPKYFGFYLGEENMNELAPYSNLVWVTDGGPEANVVSQIQRAKKLNVKVILNLDNHFFPAYGNFRLRPDYQKAWDNFAAQIAPYVLDGTIAAFYPLDEPYQQAPKAGYTDAQMLNALNIAGNTIHRTFPATPIAVITTTMSVYAPQNLIPSTFDWIGVDEYGPKLEGCWEKCTNNLSVPQIYERLGALLYPHQYRFLVPFAWKYKSAPNAADERFRIDLANKYFELGQTTPRTIGLIPFIYQNFGSGNNYGYGTNSMPNLRQRYVEIGESIKTNTCKPQESYFCSSEGYWTMKSCGCGKPTDRTQSVTWIDAGNGCWVTGTPLRCEVTPPPPPPTDPNGKPDLVITKLAFNPVTLKEGKSVRVSVTVKNTGTNLLKAGSVLTAFVQAEGYDTLIATKTVPQDLYPGKTLTLMTPKENKILLKFGALKVGATVDPDNLIQELNEENNSREQVFAIKPKSLAIKILRRMGGIYTMDLVLSNGRTIKNCWRNNKIPLHSDLVEFKGTCQSGNLYDLGRVKTLQVSVSYDAGTTFQTTSLDVTPKLTEYIFDL